MSYKLVEMQWEELIPWRDILIAQLSEEGYDSFEETSSGLKAFVESEKFDESNFKRVLSELGDVQINFEVKELEDKNWNVLWESNFEPISIGKRCVIRAPFHDVEEGFDLEIIIQPQMSFGTGHHETTYLIVEELLDTALIGKKVLDMGCGTGVLAIAARKLGCEHVVAIDIDTWSVENCRENMALNACENIDVKLGGREQIGSDTFDLILANINRNVLLDDMELYARALDADGKLMLSGFYQSDVEMLLERASEFCLKMQEKRMKNEWTMLVMVKEA